MVTFPVIQDERYTMALRLKAVFPRRARSYLVPLLFFECGLSFLSIICNYRKKCCCATNRSCCGGGHVLSFSRKRNPGASTRRVTHPFTMRMSRFRKIVLNYKLFPRRLIRHLSYLVFPLQAQEPIRSLT